MVRGLRIGLGNTSVISPSSDGLKAQVADPPTDSVAPTGTGNMDEKIMKGISVKKLRDKNKAKYYNYKIRRKINSNSNKVGNEKDKNKGERQHLIHEYLIQTPRSNRNIVGMEAIVTSTQDGTEKKSTSEA